MKFSSPLIYGTLIKRYRRFLADVELENGALVTAHCPNPGTMVGCSEPGRTVLLSDSKNAQRRNPLTWEMIKMNDTWVGVNVSVPRKIVFGSIKEKEIPQLTTYTDAQLDVKYGRGSKVDIMLYGADQNVFLNVYHVAWAENGVALFPERISSSARKSFRELTEIARQGHRAVALFFVQREDCLVLKPAEQVDREFLKSMLTAHNAGVEILAYRGIVTPEEISLGVSIPYSLD